MKLRYDAIIIGAGPAGASAAILLAQAGWSVAVVEKQRFPRRKVCGECIAASNLSLLDAMGVGETFAKLAGPPLRQVALMCGEEMICADLPPLGKGAHRWGRALGREYFDSLLLDRAKEIGACVLQPWIARAIDGCPGAFRCEAGEISSKKTVMLFAPVLILANGSWELMPSLRKTGRLPRKRSDLFAFKAVYRNTCLAGGLLPLLAFPGGYGGMVKGDHDLTTLACCLRRDVLHACRMQGRKAGEAIEIYLNTVCPGVRNALDGATRHGEWLSVGPIRPSIGMRNSRDEPFLIGNAAGEAHPIIGEGISMAIQSAWLLCERLITSGKSPHSNDVQCHIHGDYSQALRRNFAPRIYLSALLAHLAMRPRMAAGLLPILRRWPAILTYGARLSGKVTTQFSSNKIEEHL
ncbi:MAG: FAD-dependent oxidoreductase [Pseudomonadota bacterium]